MRGTQREASRGNGFVGREPLRRLLTELATRLADGHGGYLAVRGEPGIGKSRSLEEARREAARAELCVLAAAGVPGDMAPPDWLWIQVARGLLALPCAARLKETHAGALAALAPLVPEMREGGDEAATALPVESTAERFRLFDALSRLLQAAAREQPLLLLLDDLHDVPARALEPLRLLVQETEATGLAILTAYRTADVDLDAEQRRVLAELGRRGDVVDLEGLDEAEVAHLLEDDGHESALAGDLHDRTRGNPLFVRELARWIDAGPESPWPAGERRPLPDSIRATLASRLEPLHEEARGWLELGAILGREFSRESWLRAGARDLGLPHADAAMALLEAAEALEQAGVLGPVDADGTRLRLAHELLREVVVDGLGARRRAQAHAAVGLALEELPHDGDEALAALAHHFAMAMPILGAKPAVDFAERAGRRASALGLHVEAVAHFERALRWLDAFERPESSEEVRLLVALATAQRRAGASRDCIATLERCVALCRREAHGAGLARAALSYPTPAFSTGIGGALFDARLKGWLEEALELLPDRDHPLRARVLARLAASRDDRLALTVPALEMARRLDDPVVLADVLAHHRWALEGPSRLDSRLDAMRELGEIAADLSEPVLAVQATILEMPDRLASGDRAALDALMHRFGQQIEALHEPYYTWMHATARSTLLLLDGECTAAEAAASEALALGKQGQVADAPTLFGAQLMALRIEQGRAGEMLAGARELAQKGRGVPLFAASLGRLLVEAGEADEARDLLHRLAGDDLAGVPHDGGREGCLALLAEVAIALGDEAASALLYEALLPVAGYHVALGGAAYLGPGSRLLGGLAANMGALEDARQHLQAAVDDCRRLGALPWLGRALAELAEVLHRRSGPGDLDQARGLLTEARALADRCRLAGVARRVGEIEARLAATAEIGTDEHAGEAVFRLEGEVWHLSFGGARAHLPDAKGLHYLRFLLAHPGSDVHCLELVALAEPRREVQGATLEAAGVHVDAGSEVLDARAIAEVRRRIEELEHDMADAERRGATDVFERARQELAFLESELGSALGLGGRTRKLGNPNERARKAVSNRIRASYARIDRALPELGQHLRASVKTGSQLAYCPAHEMSWQTEG